MVLGGYAVNVFAENDVSTSASNTSSTPASLALTRIRAAEIAGSDVTNLVERYTQAVDLLNQARVSDYKTCTSSDCLTRANEIFASIISDAGILREKALQEATFRKVMDFGVYIPVGSFAGAFLGLYYYNAWKSYQTKRFLNMEIQETVN